MKHKITRIPTHLSDSSLRTGGALENVNVLAQTVAMSYTVAVALAAQ